MDLAEIERLVTVSYSEGPDQNAATATLTKLVAGAEAAEPLVSLLRASRTPMVLHFAAHQLTIALTRYLNSFTLTARASIRRTVLELLVSLAPQAWNVREVRASLATLFARLQKVCWFDDLPGVGTSSSNMSSMPDEGGGSSGGGESEGSNGEGPRASSPEAQLAADVLPFLQHSLAHAVVGLDLLLTLVRDVSTLDPELPSAKQRRVATVFREQALQEIFRLALGALGRSLSDSTAGEAHEVVKGLALALAKEVLSFDFIGIRSGDEADELSVIHMPASWADLMEAPDTLRIFLVAYERWSPPHSTAALECLGLCASVRHSLFRGNGERRQAFLTLLLEGLTKVLSSRKDLGDQANRHQLARALTALKANYQLKHLQETPHYATFVARATDFSLDVFRSADSINLLYYIFSFWARMAAAYSLQSGSGAGAGDFEPQPVPPSYLDRIVPALLSGFLDAVLAHAAEQADTTEDPLLDSEQLTTVLGEIPALVRIEYLVIGNALGVGLQALARNYVPLSQQNPPERMRLAVAERQLAWVVQLCAAFLAGRARPATDTPQAADRERQANALDAQLVSTLFELLNVHDTRLQRGTLALSAPAPTQHLEIAFVTFLRHVCKCYLSEASADASKALFAVLGLRCGMADVYALVERTVSKVMLVMKLHGRSHTVYEEVLGQDGLFWSLATGYSSSKLMGRSVLVTQMLQSHLELPIGHEPRSRVAFYRALGRLLWAAKTEVPFIAFVAPFQSRLDAVKRASAQGALPQDARTTLRATLADLRGLVSAIYSAESGYLEFFEWFYDEGGYYEWLVLLLQRAQALRLEEDDVFAVLNFAGEFAASHHRRIAFSVTDASGLRLFRTTAQLLVSAAQWHAATTQAGRLELDSQFKSYKLYLRLLLRALTGGYTNFGVFELYQDSTLRELLQCSCLLVFSLDLAQLDMYPKVQELVYTALETMVGNHTDFFLQLDAPTLGRLLRISLRGLQWGKGANRAIVSAACNALDRLLGRHVSNLVRAQQGRASQRALAELERVGPALAAPEQRQVLTQLLLTLFDLTVNYENVYWAVSKPLFPLLLLSQAEFQGVAKLLVASQAHVDAAKAQRLQELFLDLTRDVALNLEPSNREKFTTNLTNFRVDVKNFLDLNAFYKALQQMSKEQ